MKARNGGQGMNDEQVRRWVRMAPSLISPDVILLVDAVLLTGIFLGTFSLATV